MKRKKRSPGWAKGKKTWKKERTTDPQVCTKCGELKPHDEFYIRERNLPRKECKACLKQKALDAHYEKTAAELRFKSIRARAKRFGVIFELAVEDVERLLAIPNCQSCGVEFSEGYSHKYESHSLEIDRRDNCKGYTPENCSAICRRCNTYKSDLTVEKVEQLLVYMNGDGALSQAKEVLMDGVTKTEGPTEKGQAGPRTPSCPLIDAA